MVDLCVLCLKSSSIEANKSKLLIDLLKMLSLDPWWNTDESPMLCTNCIAVVVRALDFKINCVNTEKFLSPYLKRHSKVDLCSVYLKINKNENETHPWKLMRICRLCIRLTDNYDCYILDFLEQSHLEDIFKEYMPEMVLSKFEEPLICQHCIENFKNFADFIISCLDTKNKIKKYCDSLHISDMKQVDLKDVLRHSMKDILGGDVCYKLEKRERVNLVIEPLLLSHVKDECDSDTDVDVEDLGFYSDSSKDFNSRDSESLGNETIQKLNHFNFFTSTKIGDRIFNQCNHCDYKTSFKSKITRHAKVKHTDLYNFPIFECDRCDYKTAAKHYLTRHCLKHKKSTHVQLFHCKKCTFQSPCKAIIKGHLVTHMDPKDVKLHKCEICNFSTKYRGGLTQHLRTHMDRSKIAIFKCSIKGCSYSTIEKSYLTKHIRRHKTPCLEKVETMYCHKCPYKTEYKKHIRSHVQCHINGRIDESLLRCEHNYCKYSTRIEEKLQDHYKKKHKERKSSGMYKKK